MALIPAYNAEGTVGRVVEGTLRHIPDVLVVDDGSTDRTAQEAREAGAEVIMHGRNIGKGAALMTGFRHATGLGFDGVVTIDADLQHDPDEIPKLLEKSAEGAGIIIGARLGDREKIPKARYYTNMAGVGAISWRTGSRLLDSQSGFRLYKAEVLRGMKCSGTGFEAETEMLIRAGLKGFRIDCVPVRTIYSREALEKSSFRPVRDTYRICMTFLKSFLWRRP